MYGFRNGGRGGLGDTCSDLVGMYKAYLNPSNSTAINQANYQQYTGIAQDSGCAPATLASFLGGSTPAPAALSATTYSSPYTAAQHLLAQNPSITPAALAAMMVNAGISSSSTVTGPVLSAFTSELQTEVPSANPNVIGSVVSQQWNSGTLASMNQALSASVSPPAAILPPPPIVTPVQTVSSSGGAVLPGPPIINPQIPITPAQASQAAAQVAQQVVAAVPDSTLQQVAQAVQTAVPTATPNQITAAATNAVAAVVQAAVPAAPPAQIVQAVTAAPATPPSQIATGVQMTVSPTSVSSTSAVLPGPPAVNPNIPHPATTTTGGLIATVDQTTGNVTPAASTAGPTGVLTPAAPAGSAVPAAAGGSAAVPSAATNWCFPGDTSAPFSSAIPVCSNTMLGAAAIFALLLILGRG